MRSLLRPDGPAPVLPRPLDAAAEVWATTTGRTRTAVRAAGTVVVLVAATGGLLRGPHGPPVQVVVARASVPAGVPVTGADVEVRSWPRDLVPTAALRTLDELGPDAVSTGTLPSGAVVTHEHLVAGGAAGFAGPETAVVPVDASLTPQLPIGARLDVAAVAVDGTVSVVVHAATVVADDGTWRWLLVPRSAVAEVAGAVSRGSLSVAVLPPAPRDDAP